MSDNDEEELVYFLDQENGETTTGVTKGSESIKSVLKKLGYSDEKIEKGLSIFKDAMDASPDDNMSGTMGEATVHLSLELKLDNG